MAEMSGNGREIKNFSGRTTFQHFRRGGMVPHPTLQLSRMRRVMAEMSGNGREIKNFSGRTTFQHFRRGGMVPHPTLQLTLIAAEHTMDVRPH
jgi:hypothetical protein